MFTEIMNPFHFISSSECVMIDTIENFNYSYIKLSVIINYLLLLNVNEIEKPLIKI